MTSREALIDDYNALTDRKWDLLDQVAVIDAGRTAVMLALRDESPVSELYVQLPLPMS